jgi:hypothetical protein
MSETNTQTLIDRYAAGPAVLRAALAKVPAGAMKWRPAPGKWSAHEVVVHCADSEVNSHGRLRYLLAEKEPLIVGYDQDVWAAALDYHAHPLEPALAAVDAVRANTVPLLRTLTPEMLARGGRHTEVGPYIVQQWLTYYAEHLDVHARQIDRTVAAFRAAHG